MRVNSHALYYHLQKSHSFCFPFQPVRTLLGKDIRKYLRRNETQSISLVLSYLLERKHSRLRVVLRNRRRKTLLEMHVRFFYEATFLSILAKRIEATFVTCIISSRVSHSTAWEARIYVFTSTVESFSIISYFLYCRTFLYVIFRSKYICR